MERFLNFDPATPNPARLLNNYDFYKNMNVLDFLRDVGKYLTVNYMMSKESVKRRIEGETGISFTEFSYQLLQGYDFVLLNREQGISVQMGGSDQFGNITAGVELARKIDESKIYALTTPLLTKADGTKFGKSEGGNIWLDPKLTSPYKFYQFWLNADDRDLPTFLRYFSLLGKEEIEALEKSESPQAIKRIFAEEITRRVHGDAAFEAVVSTNFQFDPKFDADALRNLSLDTLLVLRSELPSPKIQGSLMENPQNIIDFLSVQTGIFPSRSEAKKAIQNNAVSINRVKITDLNTMISGNDLLHKRFIYIENGKKNRILAEDSI